MHIESGLEGRGWKDNSKADGGLEAGRRGMPGREMEEAPRTVCATSSRGSLMQRDAIRADLWFSQGLKSERKRRETVPGQSPPPPALCFTNHEAPQGAPLINEAAPSRIIQNIASFNANSG